MPRLGLRVQAPSLALSICGDVPKWLRERSAKPLCGGSTPPVASKMYTVYVLKSEKDSKRYIGFTENLDRRLFDHANGLVKSTRNRRPLVLIYKEEFTDKMEAQLREKFLKSGQGRAFLNRILN